MADAKEFSDASMEDPMNTSCGGGKCVNPCVQRCLPQPPMPPRPGACRRV